MQKTKVLGVSWAKMIFQDVSSVVWSRYGIVSSALGIRHFMRIENLPGHWPGCFSRTGCPSQFARSISQSESYVRPSLPQSGVRSEAEQLISQRKVSSPELSRFWKNEHYHASLYKSIILLNDYFLITKIHKSSPGKNARNEAIDFSMSLQFERHAPRRSSSIC